MIYKKTISSQFNSTATHLAQLCDCEMRQICISYYLNETFSLQYRTATTERCVPYSGPGGRGEAGCCWGGLIEGRSDGVVADYGKHILYKHSIYRYEKLKEREQRENGNS